VKAGSTFDWGGLGVFLFFTIWLLLVYKCSGVTLW
jgi:hypothetical protein